MLQSLQLALRFYYDTLGRLASRKIGLSSDYITTLTYVPGNGTNKTTGLVSTYQNGSDAAYQYEYDANGNITHIQQGDTHLYYQYDALNQLVREDNSIRNKSITYTYDDRGNILNKAEYAYVANGGTLGTAADTITYGYESEYQAWADQLTSYDGEAIRYDASGNPTTYRGYTMAWQGRRLTGATNGTNTISYSYDEHGIRTQKTVNGTVTNYNYQGSALISQVTGNDTLLFSYDAAGNVVAVNYNGIYYYYVRNGQNDIIRLIDGDNNTVVEYAYDSWGTPLSTTGTLASTLGAQNPFRYRGYVYDAETGLYYVTSRYYDPEIGRFINADSQLNAKDGILGYNLYAYCNNNPIMYSDPSGHSIILACIIVGAVIGGLAGGHIAAKVSKAQTGKVNGWAVAGGIVGGGVLGGLVGWGIGAAITAIGAAATGAAGTAAAPIVEQAVEEASTALQTYYPPNNGFSGAIEKVSLDVGTIIQRTGDLAGRFTAPAGTPSQMLSLPYDKIGQATTYLQTTQPIQALSGTVAPWFGQIGGGTQYLLLDGRVDQLIAEGILKIFGE